MIIQQFKIKKHLQLKNYMLIWIQDIKCINIKQGGYNNEYTE